MPKKAVEKKLKKAKLGNDRAVRIMLSYFLMELFLLSNDQ